MKPSFCLLLLLLATAAPRLLAARTLLIDTQQSRVDVVVKATVDSFTGHLTHCDPVITLGDDGTIQTVRVPFHFHDLVTGKDKRDSAMHEWQQTDKFPDGEFVLSSLQPLQPGRYTAQGQLTFHGKTHELSFPVAVSIDHAIYAIDGEATLDTRDFGLPIIRVFGLLKVDPMVTVNFHLQGRTP
jgi:polyisoprenoid-binding protein YceI